MVLLNRRMQNNIYSIIGSNKATSYKRYNIPSPFGYLAKKSSKGYWISVCFDEKAGLNLANRDSSLSEYINISNVNDLAIQIDEELSLEQMKEFEASIMGKHIPSGKYVPCLLDERIVILRKEFLQEFASKK
jgi:hypothetical protein